MTTTVIAAPSIRFVKGIKPEIVQEGEFKYQAGQLSFIGRKSIPGVTNSIHRYLKEAYGWTQETHEDCELAVQGAANILLDPDAAAILILACDYTEGLKPADLLEWDEDQTEKCLNAVLAINPYFVKKKEAAQDTGQAQPETHDADGTPKSPEETPKN